MFDVGFWELALIGLVMLVVVGPERLPKIARSAGLWLGRGRRMLSSVKAEIDREIKAEELKDILDKQAKSNPLESILDDAGGSSVTSSASKQTSASAQEGTGSKTESNPG